MCEIFGNFKLLVWLECKFQEWQDHGARLRPYQVSESGLRSLDFKEFGAIDLHGLDKRLKARELVFSSALCYALTSQTHWVLGAHYSFSPKKIRCK